MKYYIQFVRHNVLLAGFKKRVDFTTIDSNIVGGEHQHTTTTKHCAVNQYLCKRHSKNK